MGSEWPRNRALGLLICIWILALWGTVIAIAVFGERVVRPTGTEGRMPPPPRPAVVEVPVIDPRPRRERMVDKPSARAASTDEWRVWTASWYGEESGSVTASGEAFRPGALTAAHRSLPFGTRLEVCYRGRCVVVRVNDRGPYVKGRDLDLSRGAAEALGMIEAGVAPVRVRVLEGK